MVSNREDSRFIGLVRFVFDEVLRSIQDFSLIDFSKVRRPTDRFFHSNGLLPNGRLYKLSD